MCTDVHKFNSNPTVEAHSQPFDKIYNLLHIKLRGNLLFKFSAEVTFSQVSPYVSHKATFSHSAEQT